MFKQHCPRCKQPQPVTAQESPHAVCSTTRPHVHCAALEQPPLAPGAALRAEASCIARTLRLLGRRRIQLPAGRVGIRLRFADGSSARVFRETVADRGATLDPCVLVVTFRLRAVRFADALLGSVGQYCVHHALCPVLIMRAEPRCAIP